jgi:NAD(P)-dependent dehydrogenase (short-subunit alcohol dehydrogenase family)
MATSPFLLVLGAGPGVGTSVAREFGRRGYAVGLVARSADRLETLAAELRSEGIDATTAAADLTEEGALAGAVQTLAAGAGRVDVLHFNPSRFREAGPLEVTPAELLEDVALGAASLLTAGRPGRSWVPAPGSWRPGAGRPTGRGTVRPHSGCRRQRCATSSPALTPLWRLTAYGR